VHSVQWIESQLQHSVLLCFCGGNEENGEFRITNNKSIKRNFVTIEINTPRGILFALFVAENQKNLTVNDE
jgi:hypothetical protein